MGRLLSSVVWIVGFTTVSTHGALLDCRRPMEDERRYERVRDLLLSNDAARSRVDLIALSRALESEGIRNEPYAITGTTILGIRVIPVESGTSSYNRQAFLMRKRYELPLIIVPDSRIYGTQPTLKGNSPFERNGIAIVVGLQVFASPGSHRLDEVLAHELVHAEIVKRIRARKFGALLGSLTTSIPGYGNMEIDEVAAFAQSLTLSLRTIRKSLRAGRAPDPNDIRNLLVYLAYFTEVVHHAEAAYSDLESAMRNGGAGVNVERVAEGSYLRDFVAPRTGGKLNQVLGFDPYAQVDVQSFATNQLALFRKLKRELMELRYAPVTRTLSRPAGAEPPALSNPSLPEFMMLVRALETGLPRIRLALHRAF